MDILICFSEERVVNRLPAVLRTPDTEVYAGPAEYLLTLRATATNARPVEASFVLRCEGQRGFIFHEAADMPPA
jgi:hypothetical protein